GKLTLLFWLLPLVYILWASIHIQFVYGLLILGLGCIAPVIDGLVGSARTGEGADLLLSRHWKKLVLLTICCTVATLVNPYHVKLYGVVIQYATQPGPFR